MGWMTSGDIRDSFNVSQLFSVDESQLTFASDTALGYLKNWISPDDFVLASAANSADGLILERQKTIRRSHAFLTICILALTATQIRKDGIPRTLSNNVTGEVASFLSVTELLILREQYFQLFKSMIAPFAIVSLSLISLEEQQISQYINANSLQWF